MASGKGRAAVTDARAVREAAWHDEAALVGVWGSGGGGWGGCC